MRQKMELCDGSLLTISKSKLDQDFTSYDTVYHIGYAQRERHLETLMTSLVWLNLHEQQTLNAYYKERWCSD